MSSMDSDRTSGPSFPSSVWAGLRGFSWGAGFGLLYGSWRGYPAAWMLTSGIHVGTFFAGHEAIRRHVAMQRKVDDFVSSGIAGSVVGFGLGLVYSGGNRAAASRTFVVCGVLSCFFPLLSDVFDEVKEHAARWYLESDEQQKQRSMEFSFLKNLSLPSWFPIRGSGSQIVDDIRDPTSVYEDRKESVDGELRTGHDGDEYR